MKSTFPEAKTHFFVLDILKLSWQANNKGGQGSKVVPASGDRPLLSTLRMGHPLRIQREREGEEANEGNCSGRPHVQEAPCGV